MATTHSEADAAFKSAIVNDVDNYSAASSMLSGRMPNSVKGKGYIGGIQKNGKTVLAPTEDHSEIMKDSYRAESALVKATRQGIQNPSSVFKGLNPNFSNQLGSMMVQHPAAAGMNNLLGEVQAAFADLGKNITLTSPNATGFVPFDLVNPSRLIYPVYSPLRNKIARVAGQGTSRLEKVVTAVSGSGQSSAPALRITQSELNGGNLGTWPLNIPASGTQVSVNLNVPYRFWGMSESLSWLAQFAGQGFEDISALANLVLLQEFMLAEEYADIAGTSIATTAPVVVSATDRVAGATETGLTGGAGASLYVAATGTNFYGETVMSNIVEVTFTSGHVVDVTLQAVPGGLQNFNLYISRGAATTPPARTAIWQKVTGVGGTKFTLQGTIPTAGTNPPAADSGSSNANDQEGLLSVLSGHAANNTIYPTGWQAGYVNNAVADTLNSTVINNALAGMWANFKADPSEIIAEGSDVLRLSNDVLKSGTVGSYRLLVNQSEVGGVRDGAAVSEFQNPITRSALKIMVHPWLTQGTSMLMSYSLPMSFSNVSNVVEKVLVQDYLSISWPVIDASFRYSMYMYGALVVNAPQYCGLLQGMQVTDGNGTSTPWA